MIQGALYLDETVNAADRGGASLSDPRSGKGEAVRERLMYPKRGWKKKRRIRHPASVMHSRQQGTCFLCEVLDGNYRQYEVLHKHHVFGGPNRIHSEEYGLTVWLCVEHHETGRNAVHGSGADSQVIGMLHRMGQQAFEMTHTRREWMAIFGKNYLGGEGHGQ